MAGTVKSRFNHYQVLGIPPTASSDEVARAFARESSVFRPHVFGGLTELCVAYETLRDPIKRRSYDISIGLDRRPMPPKLSQEVRGVASAGMMARAAPVERQAPTPVPPPEAQPAATKPALPLGPGAELNATPEPSFGGNNTPYIPFTEALATDVRPIDWRRTGLILGGFVLAACTLGGLAGWWSASGIGEASPSANAAPAPRTPAEPVAAIAAPEIAVAPVPAMPKPRTSRSRPAIAATEPIERMATVPVPAVAEAPSQQRQVEAEPIEPPAVQEPTSSTTAAPMPLPNRVIARTIDRIGYSCGSVASTTPVEGAAPGVYKVRCSSGQSYQASPVNGRYRFRRLGRQ